MEPMGDSVGLRLHTDVGMSGFLLPVGKVSGPVWASSTVMGGRDSDEMSLINPS